VRERTRTAAWIALAVFGATAVSAQGPDPTTIVRKAGAIYRGLGSLQADFVQVIKDPGLGDTLTSRGRLYQAGDNAFAMRFSDPPNEAIVIDGQYVWVYTPSTNPGQVIRMRMETDPVYGVNLLARILDRPVERYTSTWLRSDSVSGRRTEVVSIVPRGANVNFLRAILWLDQSDWLPRRIELEESPGVWRMLTLSGLRPNATIDRQMFVFNRPPGVRIIDQ
jgi:outer membrane lipoprotein carrier protein